MTIKWYKISKKLPPLNTQVLLVVNLDYNASPVSKVELASLTELGWCTCHYCDYATPLEYFTHWASIELPENKSWKQ
jgi:hypothetical protein